MLVFECYAILDLIKFGLDPWIILVAIRMKSGQRLQTLGWSIVVDEPL
jgi:hypothetical protein